jgi:hypothetical protein
MTGIVGDGSTVIDNALLTVHDGLITGVGPMPPASTASRTP